MSTVKVGDRTWWRRVWLPSARDSLRLRRQRVGSRWWPLRVIWYRAVACYEPELTDNYGWTCHRHKFHGGAHRYRNYIWFDGNRAHYAPMPTSGTDEVSW